VEDTVRRALALVPPERVRILAGDPVADRIMATVPQLGPEALLREPRARGTAPVLAWAAWELARLDPEATMVSLHSDHVIHPLEGFRRVITRAAEVARGFGRLVTVGVVPDRPETGYGYVLPGAPLAVEGAPEAFDVEAFVEKPDADTAARYVSAGYLWNSGIFVWKASVLLTEIEAVAPEIGRALPYLARGDVEGFFDAAEAVSIDVAVLERSQRVATVRAAFSWDDVGSWEAVGRTREADEAGNVVIGDAHVIDGDRNIAYCEDGAVVLFGVDDLVVVHSGGMTLVTPRKRAPELKELLAALPESVRNPT
jgi:mannose-1-phosphate guanylyltransferase